jgi:hypothetical protein
VKLDVCAVVGVPLITPPEESDNPAGSAPLESDQLYGVWPPAAARVWEYAIPTVPPGRLAVVTDRSTGIVMDSALVAVSAGVWASVTWAVKLAVPAVVGVPEMTPPEERDRPAGREPEASDQLYGV